MLTPDHSYYHAYSTLMIAAMLSFAGMSLYTFLVRDKENFLISLTMSLYAIFSFTFKAQLLVSLTFILIGVLNYNRDWDQTATAMWVSAVFVFLFHGVQPHLRSWGERNGLT